MKLVIVDDDWAMLELLSVLLKKKLQHDVQIFSDSRESWEWISDDKNSCPDILISDYMMPYFDGKELIEKIRKESHCRNVPIILMSSIDNVETTDDLWDLFMHKSFDYRILSEAIHKAIAHRKLKK